MLVDVEATTAAPTLSSPSIDNNKDHDRGEKRRPPELSFILMSDRQQRQQQQRGTSSDGGTGRRPLPPPDFTQHGGGLEMMVFCGECSGSGATTKNVHKTNHVVSPEPPKIRNSLSQQPQQQQQQQQQRDGGEEKKGEEEVMEEEGSFVNSSIPPVAALATSSSSRSPTNDNFFRNNSGSADDGTTPLCCFVIEDSPSSDQQQQQPQRVLHENGEHDVIDHDEDDIIVRSTLFVGGMCCTSEVPAVRRCLRASGAEQIQINLAQKRVYVKHNPRRHSCAKLAASLSQSGFPSSVVIDGGATSAAGVGEKANNNSATNTTLPTFRPSKYVESTLKVSNLTKRHLVAATRKGGGRLLSQSQTPPINQQLDDMVSNKSLRAIHPHLNSRTIKIEHDPNRISAQQVCDRLNNNNNNSSNSSDIGDQIMLSNGLDGLDAHVLLDGAIEKLYLPIAGDDDDAAENEEGGTPASTQHRRKKQENIDDNDEWKSERLQVHVILSGIFWFVSLLSAIEGWPFLVYAGLLSVVFGLPTVAFKAWRTIKQRRFDSNCMMLLAAVGAVILGEYDEAASVSFLFSVSEYLESRATERARKALSDICHLRPSYATLIIENDNNDNNEQRRVLVPAWTLQIGSLISVRTGDKVAADGIVVDGTSSVDESSLTGESRPVHKTVGCQVAGGSMNVGNAQLLIRTTSTVDDSALSRLIRLVEEAQTNTSPTEKMIDGFARVYTPVVIVMAAFMATIPWMFGIESGRHWTLNALIIVVIACPCALTISTPVTYAAGLAATAQRGVIVKGGMHLETLGSVSTVVFDKTGTLTEGNFQVEHLVEVTSAGVVSATATNTTSTISSRRRRMLELLAVMEAPSSHPLSATLVKAAEQEGVYVPKNIKVKEHKIIKGEGVEATVNGKQTYIGNRRLFERVGMYENLSQDVKKMAKEWASRGGTVGFVGVDDDNNNEGGIVGAYCVIDSVRPEAKDVCDNLLFGGYNVVVLTGDGEGAALAVANQVGLPYDTVHSQLLPEDKLHFVGSLQRPSPRGWFRLFQRQPKVLFCGDGVNDAPALTVADVGVSIGEGAAVAMEMSDVTLLDSNLKKLVYVIKMGTRVMYTVRENILLSLFCKLIVVALTFAGYMTLMYAILSDVGVMLLVTLNGMKILPGSADDTDDAPLVQLKRRHGRKRYEGVPFVASTAPDGSGSTIAEIV